MISLPVLANGHHPSMPSLEELVIIFAVLEMRLTFDFDLSIVNDDLLVPGRHNCTADRHLLDLNTHCKGISNKRKDRAANDLLVGD
jgi:hypothetical protein